jgi:zona occludens toxin (predicted ATPase)
MEAISSITSNFSAYFKTLTTPSLWNRQTVLVVAGITLLLAAIVFVWLSVTSVEKVRVNTASAFALGDPPAQTDTNDAANAKNKAMTSAILLSLGFLCLLMGLPFAGGVFVGAAI